jgi:putative CocE/NonD family hydrolase
VFYGDRAEADRRLLTYTSAPLTDDVEITGHPVVTLYVASTATDGAFYVYLEDVDENGRVTYVTEGQLRALHRRLTDRDPRSRCSFRTIPFSERTGCPWSRARSRNCVLACCRRRAESAGVIGCA